MNKNLQVSELALPLAIIFSALVTSGLFLLDAQSIIRPIVSFAFLLLGPGYAYIRLIFINEFLIELIFSIALSLAIDILVSEILVLMALWSADLALFIVVILSIIGAFLQIFTLFTNR